MNQDDLINVLKYDSYTLTETFLRIDGLRLVDRIAIRQHIVIIDEHKNALLVEPCTISPANFLRMLHDKFD